MKVKPVEVAENDAMCRFMRHVRIVVFLILVDIHGLDPSNILCEQASPGVANEMCSALTMLFSFLNKVVCIFPKALAQEVIFVSHEFRYLLAWLCCMMILLVVVVLHHPTRLE